MDSGKTQSDRAVKQENGRLEIDPVTRRAVERAMLAEAVRSAVSTRMAVFTAFVYILLRIAAQYIHVHDAAVGNAVSIVVFMLLQLALVYYTTRIPMSAQAEGAGAAVALAFWVTFAFILGADTNLPKSTVAHLDAVRFAGAHASMIVAAAFLGMLVSRVIKDRNMVLPVAIVAAVVDILTVFRGPVGKALQTAPALVARAAVGIPQMGVPMGHGGAFVTLMGPGDFVFLGIFMACVWRFRMNAPTTFWAIYAFSLLGMLVVITPSVPYVPGLPFMAAALLLVNFHEFQLSRSERFALLYAALAGLGVLVIIALLAHLYSSM